jgi:hypothetical protein
MYAIEKRDYILIEKMLRLFDPKKLRNVIKSQTFDGTCLSTHNPDSTPTRLCSYSYAILLSGKAADTNLIVFGLI